MKTDALETNPTRQDPTLVNFWKLWAANGFSNLGDGLYQIILPLIAVQLTTSPARVSVLSMMLSLPWLLFALQAGSIVDRYDRRKVMLWVTMGRMLLLFILTMAVSMNFISLSLLYIAAFLLGVGETLVDTALTSIVPTLVGRDRLSWANSQIVAVQTVTNTFIGPPLAGFLAGIGFALATGSSTLLYLLAGVALFLVHGTFAPSRQENAPDRQKINPWDHLTQGLQFLWKDRLIRTLTLFTAAMNIFWAAWASLIVLYALDPRAMGLNEFQYGILLTAMAIGGLLGSMTTVRLQRVLGTRNALTLDFIGTILLVGVPALTTNIWAVGASAFAAGLGASVWVILVSSIRQQVVPTDLLGRVYSASRFISWGIGPFGAALAGLVAEIWGIRAMFAIGGLVSIVTLFFFIKLLHPATLQNFDLPKTSSS